MKLGAVAKVAKAICVTPRAGVWIETIDSSCFSMKAIMSPPVRGCGLKPGRRWRLHVKCRVTPRAGVWIETFTRLPEKRPRLSHPPCGGVD